MTTSVHHRTAGAHPGDSGPALPTIPQVPVTRLPSGGEPSPDTATDQRRR
jgi:hypothetical protein